MAISRITIDDPARGQPGQRSGLAHRDFEVVEILTTQPLNFFVLKSRIAHHVRKNVHRFTYSRRQNIDTDCGLIPTSAGIDEASERFDLFSDLRRAASRCSPSQQ